jgi:hypothetical protein
VTVSDLTTFRDHCARMGGNVTSRNRHLTPGERALFRRLAAEVDRYLAGDLTVLLTPEPDDEPLPLEA